GGAREVAKRANIHLPQAVSTTHRQLEICYRDFMQLLEDGVAALCLFVIVHSLACLAVLYEQSRPRMVGLVGQDMTIALLSLSEPHLVFVEDAQVYPRGQRNGRAVGAAPVVVKRQIVVAVKVINVRQLEKRAVVVFIELKGFFKLRRGLDHLAPGGQQAALLEMKLGGPFTLLGK